MKKANLIHNVFVTNEAAAPVIEEGPTVVESIQQFSGRVGNSVMMRLLKGNQRRDAQGQPITVNQGRLASLRTNDLLRKDQWKQLDQAVVEIAAVRLRPLQVLRERGLVRNLDGLGVLLSQYEQLSDMTDAEISMSGIARTQEDSANYTLISVPIPVISKDFRINLRRLLASQRAPAGASISEAIDVTQVRTATRKVSEMAVSMLFNGYGGKLDGNALTGLTNATNANTVSGSDWGTVANIYANMLTAISALQGDRMFGPYGLFVAVDQYNEMLQYIASVNQTALMRVQTIPGMQFVEPADQLASGTAVLFQLTADVIDIAIAEDITVVEWDEHGGLTAQFKVMMAYAPRPKYDADSRSGIAYISGI